MHCYLRIGQDTLEEAKPYRSKAAAIRAYKAVAEKLARYDQRCEATLHLAKSQEELAEYPDFVLSLTERGAVKVEGC